MNVKWVRWYEWKRSSWTEVRLKKSESDREKLMNHDYNHNIIDGICYNFSAILSNELS